MMRTKNRTEAAEEILGDCSAMMRLVMLLLRRQRIHAINPRTCQIMSPKKYKGLFVILRT